MEPLVVAMVLVAAVMHVAWNVLLKTAGDPLRTAAVGILVATAVVVPLAIVGWSIADRPPIPPEVLVVAGLSGLVETVYFVLLSGAYRRSELSVVYPVARGTAPLIAAAVGVVILGERPGPTAIAGVAALLAGILLLQRPWRLLGSRASAAERAAAGFAYATGACIAGYTVLDRVGVGLVEPWLYAALIWPAMAVGLWAWIGLAGRGGRRHVGAGRSAEAAPGERPAPDADPAVDPGTAAAGGLLTLAAYGLVLVALSVAPVSVIAPLRESAVVLAAGWGALRLGEATGMPDAVRRLAAAGLVLAGIVLLVAG
jgi:drug/metabolite transporter (DMT)-like permease